MAMHACQIGPIDTAPLAQDRQTGLRRDKGGNTLEQATFLPPFLLCYSSVRMLRLHSPFVLDRSGSQVEMVNWLPHVSEVDWPGSSSASVAGLLRAKMGGNGKIRHWVLGGGGYGRPCRSHAITILRCIVRATKAATWSHPSVLFSIIGTKLSGIRGGSLIFSRAVITSSRYSQSARHSNKVCQALSSRPLLSQLEHSELSSSFMRNR